MKALRNKDHEPLEITLDQSSLNSKQLAFVKLSTWCMINQVSIQPEEQIGVSFSSLEYWQTSPQRRSFIFFIVLSCILIRSSGRLLFLFLIFFFLDWEIHILLSLTSSASTSANTAPFLWLFYSLNALNKLARYDSSCLSGRLFSFSLLTGSVLKPGAVFLLLCISSSQHTG